MIYPAVLALATGAALYWLADERDEGLDWRAYGLLALGAFFALQWARDPLAGASARLAPELGPRQAAWLALPCLVFLPLGFAALGRSARAAAFGLGAAAFFCAVGFWAYRWIPIAQALRGLGRSFAAGLLDAVRPLLLAGSCALGTLVLRHRDFSGWRLSWLMGLLILWGGPTWAVESWLRARWGFGPRDLSEAAQVTPDPPPELTLADLSGPQARLEPRTLRQGKLALTPGALARLDAYLRERRGDGVFAREASSALRAGFLAWWEADLALDSHSQALGLIRPDYRQALALLRAGPLTGERFERLLELEKQAQSSSAGFESVLQSQFIFEGFSAAFGRFGDSKKAREWLLKIDRLWPVYEKKIEASPVESMDDGVITGTLLIDGEAARDVKVGLFYLPSSTATYRDGANLCCSLLPDEEGRFRFSRLGAGRYHLALLGDAETLSGGAGPSPGSITLTHRRRREELAPIKIYNTGREPRPAPEAP